MLVKFRNAAEKIISGVTTQDVRLVYQVVFGREPESEKVIACHLGHKSLRNFLQVIAESEEFQARQISHNLDRGPDLASPFWHYNSEIDTQKIIRKHENLEREEKEGHSVNYLGIAVNVARFFPNLGIQNGLESIPIPANWHADIAEFSAALRAVDLSGNTFTMIELGCGWGCWMNNTGAAARRLNKQIMLIGVEGDEDHLNFCHESMATNGFLKQEYNVMRGIVAANSGVAFFPRQQTGGVNWGGSPIFTANPHEIAQLMADGGYEELPVIALQDIIGGHARIDLLHIDIQGDETDLIEGTLDLLREKVAYIVIGTHSREIEGRLMKALFDSGWALEIERPCIFTLQDGRPRTTVDGLQGWRNLSLG